MKTIKWPTILGVAAAVLGMSTAVQAVPITGSISFTGTAAFNNAPHTSIGTATGFTSINAFVNPFSLPTGDYSAIPGSTAVTFSTFTFNPPASSVTPLWTLSYSGVTYAFNATSMTANFNSSANTWTLSGSGTATITGGSGSYTDTAGTWNMASGTTGTTFFFGSTTTVQSLVPDGGMTAMLLGAALSAMVLLRKKLMV